MLSIYATESILLDEQILNFYHFKTMNSKSQRTEVVSKTYFSSSSKKFIIWVINSKDGIL